MTVNHDVTGSSPVWGAIFFRGIAPMVEQRSPKPRVLGSSPSAPATSQALFAKLAIFFMSKNR